MVVVGVVVVLVEDTGEYSRTLLLLVSAIQRLPEGSNARPCGAHNPVDEVAHAPLVRSL